MTKKKPNKIHPDEFDVLQSASDFVCAIFLLLTSFTVVDGGKTNSTGWLGKLECSLWNTKAFLWGALLSSTWNLVFLTIERWVLTFDLVVWILVGLLTCFLLLLKMWLLPNQGGKKFNTESRSTEFVSALSNVWHSPFTHCMMWCFVFRCVELLHPFWHMTHFNTRWTLTMIVLSWIIGYGLMQFLCLQQAMWVEAAFTLQVFCMVGPKLFWSDLFSWIFSVPILHFKWFFLHCEAHQHSIWSCSFQMEGNVCVRYQWPNETCHLVMGFLYVFAQFILPLLIIAVCYGCILHMLTRRIHTNVLGESGKAGYKNNKNFEVARKNTIVTLFIVSCFFIICWSQNQIIFFMYNLGYNLDLNGTYYHYSVLMIFLNCTVNPFIYLFKYRDFQIALKIFCKCNKSNTGSQSNVYSLSENTLQTSE